jgi:hypothetical protein
MCVSMAPAEFSGTTLYAGRRRHPEHGLVHVLGYQNTALNLASGPNAMLLHLPARRMTGRQFLHVGDHSDVLRRMVDAVRPRTRRGPAPMGWMGAAPGGAVEVFEHDVYTVLLADDPMLLPGALEQVPERKRPRLDPALMAFYAEAYPDHPLAVCCFDNADAREAKPLLLWYEPHDPDLLLAPALDCHTGGPPDLDRPVDVDHWVLFGTDEAPADWGAPVTYGPRMRHRLRGFLPDRVMGVHHAGPLPNGDFALAHADLLAGDLGRVRRVQPGGTPAGVRTGV